MRARVPSPGVIPFRCALGAPGSRAHCPGHCVTGCEYQHPSLRPLPGLVFSFMCPECSHHILPCLLPGCSVCCVFSVFLSLGIGSVLVVHGVAGFGLVSPSLSLRGARSRWCGAIPELTSASHLGDKSRFPDFLRVFVCQGKKTFLITLPGATLGVCKKTLIT